MVASQAFSKTLTLRANIGFGMVQNIEYALFKFLAIHSTPNGSD